MRRPKDSPDFRGTARRRGRSIQLRSIPGWDVSGFDGDLTMKNADLTNKDAGTMGLLWGYYGIIHMITIYHNNPT
jgi:hypothetical protein